jgi:two-component system chemotaxis sensor kinase CheA
MSDDPILQTFLIECTELLEEMESSLLQLENAPDDEDIINALFRAAHTIKGSSGIVGFEQIERFTHKGENILEKVRQGDIKVTEDLIELLLKCRDHTAVLLDAAMSEKSEDASIESTEKELVNQLNMYLDIQDSASAEPANETTPAQEKTSVPANDELNEKATETDNWHISLRFGQDVMRNGMDPLSFINYLSRLGEIVSLTTITDAVPSADEMDPESCYLGFEIDFKSDFDKQTIDDVFEFVQEDCKICILPPHSSIDQYISLIHDLPESPSKLGEILIKGGALTSAELEEALQMQSAENASSYNQEAHKKIGEILVDEGMVHPPVVEAALEKQKTQKEARSREAKTIRVDTGKLDQLVNLVGELVISNANINQHAQRIGDLNLLESASALSRLVEDIRDGAMQVRMIPIGEIFSRFHRVVRDISRNSDKQIELIISGGETELDKNLIEKINDPLMHLVRNAADHGIEEPDVRAAKDKPRKGTVRLNAFQDTGSIVIEITDDGGGLNRDRIMKKALDRGLISEGQTLSDKEIYRLIFEPGFSTAEEVTNLSGRGVGMDVVRRNIEALRGSVEVESAEGVGTTVSISLPLTLAIIDGFSVNVGRSSYIIPLDMVVECIELSETDREVSRKKNYVNLREEVLPYLRLRDIFKVNGEKSKYESIVVVQSAGQRLGLVVDELNGEVQAVIKSLGNVYKDIHGVSGATILGNGTVALILDVPSLIKTVEIDDARIKTGCV